MTVTMADARAIADGVVQRASSLGLHVSCSVVDERGFEIVTMRMDGAPWFTPDVARTKARTAAVMGQSTAEFAALGEAYPALLALIDEQLPFTATTLPGGIAVLDGSEVLAGVGVSGAHPDEDIACARFAVATWQGA